MHPTRRDILRSTAGLLAAHTLLPRLAFAQPLDADPFSPRIRRIGLRTATDLDVMAAYYADTLGLPVERPSGQALVIRAGATEITFIPAAAGDGAPWCHFAFNIPENKITLAHDWQRERGELIPTPPHMLDPDYPEGVRHFRNWNAHSVFFFDPAGNVLEYIARHTLATARPGPFTPRDILYASEIAFTSDDVPGAERTMRDHLDIDRYKSAPPGFRAMGDERGLLLIFQTGRPLAPGADAEVHPAFAEWRSEREGRFFLPDSRHEILARA